MFTAIAWCLPLTGVAWDVVSSRSMSGRHHSRCSDVLGTTTPEPALLWAASISGPTTPSRPIRRSWLWPWSGNCATQSWGRGVRPGCGALGLACPARFPGRRQGQVIPDGVPAPPPTPNHLSTVGRGQASRGLERVSPRHPTRLSKWSGLPKKTRVVVNDAKMASYDISHVCRGTCYGDARAIPPTLSSTRPTHQIAACQIASPSPTWIRLPSHGLACSRQNRP